jgi:5-formyltetrahydrofolate cyclo-ligase
MNKSEIRQIYKEKRLSLSPNKVAEESEMIANNFIQNLLPKIKNFSDKKLAFYVAANNEVDPIFILQHCQKLGNIISLPKIIPNLLELEFRTYKTGDELVRNEVYTKILEPKNLQPNIIPDIIFVPLIAFDKNCARIGMGGGFYDATIKNFRKNSSKNSEKIFIGLGFDWQNYPKIPSENIDQSLNFVVCVHNVFSCSQ